MCGRYSLTSGAEILTSTFGLKTAPSLAPRYNISPSQKCSVILKIDDIKTTANVNVNLNKKVLNEYTSN